MFVITGGGTGIGRALAEALAKRANPVLVIGRRQAPLEETAALSSLIKPLVADITTEKGRLAIQKALEGVVIQGLIHNAGVIEPIKPVMSIRSDEWMQALTTNLTAPLLLTQALRASLKGGRLLHIGTGASHIPIKGWGAYCVSKAALSMLTRMLQLECHDLLVASVMPGIIDTAMQEIIRDNPEAMDSDKSRFFETLFSSGKLLKPEVVGLFLSWLLLDVPANLYVAKEWDIYDVSHHSAWLTSPYEVPFLD